jgi:hypothetical protein
MEIRSSDLELESAKIRTFGILLSVAIVPSVLTTFSRALNVLLCVSFLLSSGSNVSLKNCYLWGENSIGDGAVVEDAILADGVVIRKFAKIGRGSVLSFHVRSRCFIRFQNFCNSDFPCFQTEIGEGFSLAPFSKITKFGDTDGSPLKLAVL